VARFGRLLSIAYGPVVVWLSLRSGALSPLWWLYLPYWTTETALTVGAVLSGPPREAARWGWRDTALPLLASVLAPALVPLVPVVAEPAAARWLGVGLAFGAYVPAAWAALYLGRSFSLLPEARRLAASGPYRWVRHPLYAAYLLWGVGVLLADPTPAMLAVITTFATLLAARARVEEGKLAAALPGYAEYLARTGMFWPRPGLPPV
jgi:protein-S-isoprenylcysteine O-methyltransferase Ste14